MDIAKKFYKFFFLGMDSNNGHDGKWISGFSHCIYTLNLAAMHNILKHIHKKSTLQKITNISYSIKIMKKLRRKAIFIIEL